MKTLLQVLTFCLLLGSFSLSHAEYKKGTLSFFTLLKNEKLEVGIQELKQAAQKRGLSLQKGSKLNAGIIICISNEDTDIQKEGFKIGKTNGQIILSAIDHAGVMYGCFELAEQIKLFGLGEVKSGLQNPDNEIRGTKFNIPLDLRTPSYTDASDAAQKNMLEMWNINFWKEYIDNLAKHRYNFVSLWSLHPFPSMIKVPKYKDIALDDVHQSTAQWDEYYHTHGTGLDAPNLVEHYKVIKKITIDEKIAFWKEVMAYGKSRNVSFYFITWNIFVNGTFGKYGITEKEDNPITKDYFKESVKEMFRTYPDLAGIGLTTGENMDDLAFEEKENWVFDTYGKAILEVSEEMPDRTFTFIHRQHFSDPKAIEEKFKPLIDKYNIDFIYSFKYAKAHVMSAVKQPYHKNFVKNIGNVKSIWCLRNDDNYFFRWGAPDFVREFLKNIPPKEVSQGIYYGSDQWVWGREWTSKQAESPRQLEVVKHWYHWLMWGRLSYNTDLDNERFIAILQDHFPETSAKDLFYAWQEASMIYPVTTGFHWGTIDIKWYIEGCRSRANTKKKTGFHDVNYFIKYPVHKYANCIKIPEYVKNIVNGTSSKKNSPLQVSEQLKQHVMNALNTSSKLEKENNSFELKQTLLDIRTMAALGNYYSYKISGSAYVALYKETNDKNFQEKAVIDLTKALDAWKEYVDYAIVQNVNPIWTNRVGYVDWVKTTELVKKDIDIAKE